MSFFFKTILGDGVVHPPHVEAESGPSDHQQPKQEAPTHTLILRVQSCTVAQDRRDALKGLQTCPDLPYVMAAKDVSCLCNMLRNSDDDDEIVELSLTLLSSITDVTNYPSGLRTYNFQAREKRNIRDSFLHELVSEVPLFLKHVGEGSFWSRFHAVQMLQRLQEYDPFAVHKLLLSFHGIGVLVNILGDNSHGGALRNEGLVLITSITATDTELQTLLAFENAFDTLFTVIMEEGGIDGGIVVSDCLTIMHNMLRGNRPTQRLFCDMGCARLLCRLIESVLERLRATLPGKKTSCKDPVEKSLDIADSTVVSLSHAQNVVILMSVSILSCVLRGVEAGQESTAAQDSLLQSAVLGPLASLALSGLAVDDAVRVEAMRTLAALMQDQKLGVEEFMGLQVVTVLQKEAPVYLEEWTASRALLHMLIEKEDGVMQAAAAHVFHALLSVSVCEERIATELLKGFDPSALSFSMVGPHLSSSSKSVLASSCGAALSTVLFGPLPHAGYTGKYYAALVLDRLLSVPMMAGQLLFTEQHEGVSASSVEKRSVTMPVVVAAAKGSALLLYVQYVIKSLRGHGELDLNTLSACFRLLLRWAGSDSKTVYFFLSDATHYKAFLQCAAQNEGPVHVRFWAAVLCAALCIAAPRGTVETKLYDFTVKKGEKQNVLREGSEGTTLPPSSLLDRQQLLDLFFNYLGGPSIFDSLLFDMKASSPMWLDPPKNSFLRPTPALYDEAMKETLLGVIREFKEISSPHCTIRDRHPAPKEIHILPHPNDTCDASVVNEEGTAHDRPLENAPPAMSGAYASFDHSGMQLSPQRRKEQYRIQEQKTGEERESVACGKVDTALRDAYEAEVRELTEKNAELQNELQLLREQMRLEEERNKDEAERERKYADEVNELKENIRLLEEALVAKEEEHQILAESLNMLEGQLRATIARNGVDNSKELEQLRLDLQNMTEDRDQLLILVAQLDEERIAESPSQQHLRPSTPPPPPPLSSSSLAAVPFAQEVSPEVPLKYDDTRLPINSTVTAMEKWTPQQIEPHRSPEPKNPNGFSAPNLFSSPSQPSHMLPVATSLGQVLSDGCERPAATEERNSVSNNNSFSQMPPDVCIGISGDILDPSKQQFPSPSSHPKSYIPLKFNPFANMEAMDNDSCENLL